MLVKLVKYKEKKLTWESRVTPVPAYHKIVSPFTSKIEKNDITRCDKDCVAEGHDDKK